MSDLVGPYPSAASHAAVAAAGTIAALLRVDACEVDVHGVTRARVDLVAGAGLLGLGAPREAGGGGVPAEVVREVTEVLAGADGSTWFVLAQHRGALEAVLRTENVSLRSHWLSALASGDALGAVAFSHLRRAGQPSVVARRVDGGWRIDGDLDTVTGWGLADALMVMASTDDGDIVQAVLELPRGAEASNPRPGLHSAGLVPVAAMAGTHTHAVRADGVLVTDEEVASVVPKAEWDAADAARTANAPPHAFGLARAVVDALHRSADEAPDAGARATLAEEFAHEVRELRAEAYRLVDDVAPTDRLVERRALRAQTHDVTLRAAAAYLTASSGSGIRLSHDAQRYVREAAFHLVQAQTPSTRDALLARFP
jgi:alkylation response protein AidB-like acyl-CoA dehydrogenase